MIGRLHLEGRRPRENSSGIDSGLMKENKQFARGIELFNAGKFFEAHEAWEELWLRESGDEKTGLQGLIQVAAAFHHHGRQNRAGTESLLAAGLAKLAELPETFGGIELARLRRDAKTWAESHPGNYPKIKLAVRKGRERKRNE